MTAGDGCSLGRFSRWGGSGVVAGAAVAERIGWPVEPGSGGGEVC